MELTPEQDKRCDEIVEKALAIQPELRHDFTVQEAAGDQVVLKAAFEMLDLIATDLPTEFGAYEVIQHIGSGGMGDVYLARDPDIDRLVAIKVLKDWGAPAETRRRFIVEAKTLGKIDHPNVVKIYNCFPREKRPYFVMEYVKGESLATAIRDQRCGDFKERLAIARQISDAARAVHNTGTLHRDIKTDNVILAPDGAPKLLDFGIARAETSAMTDPSLRMGTLCNLAPEVIAGEPASVASDIYAYGLLLFELFTGIVPFEGDRREILEGVLGRGINVNILRDAHLTREMEDLIRSCTAQEPHHRPRNFEEIIAVLGGTRSPSGPYERRILRAPIFVPIAASIFLVIAGAIVYRSSVYTPASSANRVPTSPTSSDKASEPGTRENASAGPPASATKDNSAPVGVAPPPAQQKPPPLGGQSPREAPSAPSVAEPKNATGSTSNPGQTTSSQPSADDSTQQPARGASSESATLASTAAASHAETSSPPGNAHSAAPSLSAAESAEEEEWARVRASRDQAILRAFLAKYPTGRHSQDARETLSALDYDAVKNSSDPRELRKFALEYPDQELARVASSRALQLEMAAAEIDETLKRYATAIERMKINEVSKWRDLNKQQRQVFDHEFQSARKIDASLVPTSAPVFEQPVIADPSAANATPSQATIHCVQNMLIDSGTGDAHPERHELTIHLKRTDQGWIITDLYEAGSSQIYKR